MFINVKYLSTHTGGMILVMKKILITLLLVALAASPAFAIVEGSVHDLSIDGPSAAYGNSTEIRICAYCHTPHHANVVGDYMPLWSHATTQIASFTPYASATFNGDDAGTYDPMRGGSLLCMSCHDGAVAPDSYYGDVGSAAPGGDGYQDFGIGLAGDMSNDHPIGMSYSASVTNGDAFLVDPAAALGAQYGIATISEVLGSDGTITDLVTCASCHDVHNGNQVVAETSVAVTDIGVVGATKSLLYGPQKNSQICTMCHVK